ncbi:hypothetical protein Sjap_000157 [Stephania japonica]|uniref:KIB1-4 beta-propeller domain-containing protein n=1 Tax=Stephania japonica TaxID=461633 RepID=A0AAP0PQG6_9MAGN
MDRYSKIPYDILHVIARKLTSLVCYAAFRSVCRSWRSFSLQHYSYLVPPQPPWLMLPNSVNPSLRVCDFYNFDGTRKFFQFSMPDQCQYYWCSGTWLIFTDKKVQKFRVSNPLSSTHILLPCLASKPEIKGYICKKFIVSSGPLIKNIRDVIFGVIYNDKNLAIIRLGDKAWTPIKLDFSHKLQEARFDDIIFYGGKLHAINEFGRIFVCEEDVNIPCDKDYHRRCPVKPLMLIDHSYKMYENPDHHAKDITRYLVEVNGDLMHVLRFTNGSDTSTSTFSIFKLDFSTNTKSYPVKKSDLRGHSLFLCPFTCSASAIVSDLNCVYLGSYHERPISKKMNWKLMSFDYFKKKQYSSSILFKVKDCDVKEEDKEEV